MALSANQSANLSNDVPIALAVFASVCACLGWAMADKAAADDSWADYNEHFKLLLAVGDER